MVDHMALLIFIIVKEYLKLGHGGQMRWKKEYANIPKHCLHCNHYCLKILPRMKL